MTEREIRTIAELPTDWWKERNLVVALSHAYNRNLLALHVSFRHGAKTHFEMFTGFIVEYRGRHFWVTAGHVISRILMLLKDSAVRIGRSTWFEPSRGQEQADIHVDLQSVGRIWNDSDGEDIGAIELRPYYWNLIAASDDVVYITSKSVDASGSAPAVGYYLLGFPGHWQEWSETKRNSVESQLRFSQSTVSVPLTRIQDEGPRHALEDFWGVAGALYGKLHDVEVRSGEGVGDIRGMSGGPVFSIGLDADGKPRTMLVGIQSSWLEGSRIIRATPASAMLRLLDQYIG